MAPSKINVKAVFTVLVMSCVTIEASEPKQVGRFIVKEVDETSLSKEQLVRLRCVEIIHSTNAHAGVSSNEVEVSDKAATQIREMTVWCEHFILEGSAKDE